jgi:hypothetical protein
VHWSDLLAVRAEARGSHVGERLKRYQRELCRAGGSGNDLLDVRSTRGAQCAPELAPIGRARIRVRRQHVWQQHGKPAARITRDGSLDRGMGCVARE